MQMSQKNDIMGFQDLGFVKKYASKNEMAVEESEMIFTEMKKFLTVCFKNDKLTPSRHVDKMWHEYILHTKNYEELSNQLGRHVHHVPMDEFDVDGYERAQEKIILAFGEINKDVWPEVKTKSAGCCYGDCSM